MRTLVFNKDDTFEMMVEDLVRGGCPCHVEFNGNPNEDKVIEWIIQMDEDMDLEFIHDRFTSNNQKLVNYMNSKMQCPMCKMEIQ